MSAIVEFRHDDGTVDTSIEFQEDEPEDDGEDYCYNCCCYHTGEVSSGDWASSGCDDYYENDDRGNNQ